MYIFPLIFFNSINFSAPYFLASMLIATVFFVILKNDIIYIIYNKMKISSENLLLEDFFRYLITFFTICNHDLRTFFII